MSRFAARSTSATVNKDDQQKMLELIQQDLRDLGRIVNAIGVTYLSATDRIVIPFVGAAKVYLVTNTATAGSTGVAYHTLAVTRSGQSEGQLSIDTRNDEMAAYKPYYCGSFSVGFGDIISFTLAVTGAPAPTLTTANLSILCILTPTEMSK